MVDKDDDEDVDAVWYNAECREPHSYQQRKTLQVRLAASVALRWPCPYPGPCLSILSSRFGGGISGVIPTASEASKTPQNPSLAGAEVRA